jgi:predicted AlkP superfamily phosphohydrolase/phosphomutase
LSFNAFPCTIQQQIYLFNRINTGKNYTLYSWWSSSFCITIIIGWIIFLLKCAPDPFLKIFVFACYTPCLSFVFYGKICGIIIIYSLLKGTGESMESNSRKSKIMMIGLDASEPDLIERWMADGSLPNLGRLRNKGAYGRLDSCAEWLSASPWISFYTSTHPSQHGYYFPFGWRPLEMKIERPNPDWLPYTPFWWRFGHGDPRIIVLDVPHSYQPETLNGFEIRGWSTHENHDRPKSYPSSKLEWVINNFGELPLTNERYEAFTINESLFLRDELIETTKKITDFIEYAASNEPWDFFLASYVSPHRGGHKFWDSADLKGDLSREGLEEFNRSLRQIYVECDRSIGRIIKNIGVNTTLMIFSLHGMGANTSRVEVLPEMLKRVLSNGRLVGDEPRSIGFLQNIRQKIPSAWRYEVKHRLPLSLQDRLGLFWRMGDVNWSGTQAFCLVGDCQGFIRINLKGRETKGIVEPGDEYETLIRKITKGLSTYLDADTKEPLIQEIKHTRQLFPTGPRMDKLPDLIVRWSEMPAYKHRQIISDLYGTIEWPSPGKNPNGHSGNHRGQGFLIASGRGFKPGSNITGGNILDLAPTVLDLFGMEKYPGMEGGSLVRKSGE